MIPTDGKGLKTILQQLILLSDLEILYREDLCVIFILCVSNVMDKGSHVEGRSHGEVHDLSTIVNHRDPA